jgi:hypothetical protein
MSPAAESVSRTLLLPLASITLMSPFPVRSVVYAIERPSGAQVRAANSMGRGESRVTLWFVASIGADHVNALPMCSAVENASPVRRPGETVLVVRKARDE